ncbi:F-box protein At4g00755-like [Durio zibethinus]|uniref:F-box protein At4g00755-like n=1 Tax=Durio zibethinus TaxID=66656 RepID=A0A6P5Y456_DURZI|nr:F-box protein At4g00755-like [Durio zibethinus]XP_022735229.1 F-box protein At4g00755-like [Durio zibethinus]XP_022735230.1 F-box protein At4g00755-like [Durio zibethinus]XP_022735231.1 F-box protein At4g00755-like [Durio zibethinus]
MKNGVGFLNFLHHDLLIKILTSLDDPSDLVRFSAVSLSCRHFVITNGLCKRLCLRMFPQLSRVDHVNELGGTAKRHAEAGSSNFMEWEALEREHRVYALLARYCLSSAVGNCISEAIMASSTDNYPQESIDNTLEPRDRVAWRASYWSSKGQRNPAAPERLTYKLVGDLCVVTEIKIKPFQAYFHIGYPIYSAKSVRFRMGHIKSSMENHVDDSYQDSGNDKFVWTYTSQEFPMAQENHLQCFKLPDPILCIGGILQIELLERVQGCWNGLFYICVSNVQAMGRPLSPAFGIQILEPPEKFVLEALSHAQPTLPEQTSSESSLQMRVKDLEQIVNSLLAYVDEVEENGFGWDTDTEESDADEEGEDGIE